MVVRGCVAHLAQRSPNWKIQTQGGNDMPRTKKTPVSGPVSPDLKVKKEALDLDWGGWIDIRMTDELKDAFTKWFEASGNLFWALLEEILADGLKASCSWDATNNCFVA